MSFTEQQLKAIDATGNTLVVAGAGAGKTGTLVERCIRLLLRAESPVTVDRVLVVTFTEAAAAEVRERVRARLEKALEENPASDWIQRQIAIFDSAKISTLHSFCLALVREHFYELDLDPAVTVMPAEQAEMLFLVTFEELIAEHYAGKHRFSAALKELLQSHFGGWDKRLHSLVRQLHHFTQTRPHPEKWFGAQLERLDSERCEEWHRWYAEYVRSWREWWHPYLASLPEENENAHHCAELLRNACRVGDMSVVTAVLARENCWPKGKTGKHKPAFKALFDEANFLASVADPAALDEDWQWSRAPLRVLLQFTEQFTERFTTAKRDRGLVDFHDLEQCALKLLWDAKTQHPTALAESWRERLEAIFVDEYQDINAAQDLIISTLSREQAPGNRFLVGDIKQSIYRFRQADPTIFRSYLGMEGWTRAALSDNFRSHEGILQYINPLFRWLMREDIGGIDYDEEAALRCGGREERPEMAQTPGQRWPVELNLLLKNNSPTPETAPQDELTEADGDLDLENAEKEARLVAQRLRELRKNGRVIYHRKEKRSRPVDWKDMVVLLRAAAGKLELYARAFEAMGVPLQTKRDGFFTTPEVLDLVNVLTILDNPLQDIPLVAVLRSPIVGMTANELATVRVHAPKGRFWNALNQFFESKKNSDARNKIERFLEQFHRWRDPRFTASLGQRLELILSDTGYAEWLLSQPRGRQRHANVQQLLRVARQFDDTRGESLYLFLRHLQELQEAAGDIEPASLSEENSVRLMTVHQSKGLEFSVVAVADLGKPFNNADQSSSILLHEKYGLCATVQPPNSVQRYSSLPLWLASQQEKVETAGEEMRALYVGLTRAENILLLFGATTERRLDQWAESAVAKPFPQQLLRLRSWLDWIGSYASCQWGQLEENAESLPFTVRVHREVPPPADDRVAGKVTWTREQLSALYERMNFQYSHSAATCEHAKTTVTALRRRASDEEKEARSIAARFSPSNAARSDEARERGLATHTFLQHHDPRGQLDRAGLQAQAGILVARGLLNSDKLIDFEGIAEFWETDFGREAGSKLDQLRREMPFTLKLARSELDDVGLGEEIPIPTNEFVLVQGVADFVLMGNEISLVDFKTDVISGEEIEPRAEVYKPQIAIYTHALERIYNRPVTRRGLYFLALKRFVWF